MPLGFCQLCLIWHISLMVPDELFGLLFYNVGLREGSENSHDAGLEVAIFYNGQSACLSFAPERHTNTIKYPRKVSLKQNLTSASSARYAEMWVAHREMSQQELTEGRGDNSLNTCPAHLKEKQFSQCFTSTLLLSASTWLMVHYSLLWMPSLYFSYCGNTIHSSR